MGKTKFAHFEALKQILNKTCTKFFFLAMVHWSKMKVFANFSKQILKFKDPVIFFDHAPIKKKNF